LVVICLLLLCTAFNDALALDEGGDAFKLKVVTKDPWEGMIDVDMASLASDGFIIDVPEDYTLDAVYLDATEVITLLHGEKEFTTGEIPVTIPDPVPGKRILLKPIPGSLDEGILFLLMPEGSENNPAFITEMTFPVCTGATGAFTPDYTIRSIPIGIISNISDTEDKFAVHITPEGLKEVLAAFDHDTISIDASVFSFELTRNYFTPEAPCKMCFLRCLAECAPCEEPCNKECDPWAFGCNRRGAVFIPEEEACQDCIFGENEECRMCLGQACKNECFGKEKRPLTATIERHDCLQDKGVTCPGCAGQSLVNDTLSVTGDGTEQEIIINAVEDVDGTLECELTYKPPPISHLNPKGYVNCDSETCTNSSKYTATMKAIKGDIRFSFLFGLPEATENLVAQMPFSYTCMDPSVQKPCLSTVKAAIPCPPEPPFNAPPDVKKMYGDCINRVDRLSELCSHSILSQEIWFELFVTSPEETSPSPSATTVPTVSPEITPTIISSPTPVPTPTPATTPTPIPPGTLVPQLEAEVRRHSVFVEERDRLNAIGYRIEGGLTVETTTLEELYTVEAVFTRGDDPVIRILGSYSANDKSLQLKVKGNATAPTTVPTATSAPLPTPDAGTVVDRGDAEEALSKVERLKGRAEAKGLDTAEIDSLVTAARADMDDGAYADALRRLSTVEADLAEKLSEGDKGGSRNRMEMFMQFLEVAFGAAAFIIAMREARRREWVPGARGTTYAGAAVQPQVGAYANYGSYYGTYTQYPGYGPR